MLCRYKLATFIFVLLLSALVFAETEDEFEGTYTVGSTSCHVTPMKMVYEVKWKKGFGTQVFFFETESSGADITFVSEPKEDGVDRFQFDDKSLNNGIFISSDGKLFLVRQSSSGIR